MTIQDDTRILAEKFRDAEEKVAEERGGFYLFGLFERQRSPGRWDLVASAPWLKTDREGTVELIVLLRDKMDTEDWKVIGGVFPTEPTSDFVKWITSNYYLNHQVQEERDSGFSNVAIGRAILITVNSSPTPATRQPLAA